MEINTPIAEDIRITDQKAQYDAACRRLLSNKTILAWIMKIIMPTVLLSAQIGMKESRQTVAFLIKLG